ncbi:Man1-Src1p-C-terminal domain-containing protein [Emericellopsis atlantica]|uniref:Man1-Src1p-C-terminal domain-containing protein n=1 Tax=Emericellopsis atlantica TaxID=2614577 RepID=A0A9P7ZUD4_9HYPO|nr:Man1-Src1p-C-terminal domain-containing protein [Emericellopsis atlantica]KAG9257885.1 Man1-Src1p-C-terminal domain-containing protein [Emericellopsis atlantica]
MADMEDYLQSDFDPSKVTMPRLRSILVTHDIGFPATAKKAQLVQLVNEQVMPQVSKLRAQKLRAKRSSMGIVNAGSAEDVGDWDDSIIETPASVRRGKSPRKSSTRLKSEEYDESHMATPRVTSRQSRASRSVSRAQSHADDYEAPKSTATRRVSRRTVTPSIKDESGDDNDNPFSDDNPFQSGVSPTGTVQKTPRNNYRRRLSEIEAAKSAQSARRSTGQQAGLSVSKTRRQQQTPQPEFDDTEDDSDDMEPGEEFTPDAQLELEAAASQGEVMPPRKTSRSAAQKSSRKTPLAVLLVTLLSVYAGWWRQEKIAVGYCNLGRSPQFIVPADWPIPDSVVPFLEPQCEQCPPHAYCYENFETRCEQDFILRPHPLSFGGLVPLPPSCEPDGEKARRVKAVADKAIEELRDRRAKFECGELVDEAGHQQDSPSIDEEELKETVSAKRNKKLNSAEFEDLWIAAIGEITAREEVSAKAIENSNSTGFPNRQLSSTSLARVSLRCSVRRAIRRGVERYRLAAGLLVMAFIGALAARAKYRRHVMTSRQVPALVETVLTKLLSQKEVGAEDDEEDPWLFLPNLRDDVLRSVHSLREREHIWQKVKAVVEMNSNVRTSQREGANGEFGRAWEWIGPLGIEGARRRRSGRQSLLPDSNPVTPGSVADSVDSKKWQESRPIY